MATASRPVRSLGDIIYKPYVLRNDTGRELYVTHFNQYRTYGNQLEGIPFEIVGEEELGLRCHWSYEQWKVPVLIIDRKIIRHDKDREDFIRRRNHILPAIEIGYLAPITCVARLESKPVETANKEKGDLSALAIMWFQEEYSSPIEPHIREKIVHLDWDEFAENYEI